MSQSGIQKAENLGKLYKMPGEKAFSENDDFKENDGLFSTEKSDENRIQLAPEIEPLRVLGCMSVCCGFALTVLFAIVSGLAAGYWWPDMIDWRGQHVMDPFTSRINDDFWRKRVICRGVIEDLDAAVVGFQVSAEELQEHGRKLASNELYFEAILTHYAALSLVLRDATGKSNLTLQRAMWDYLFLAKRALRPIHSQIYGGAKEKLTCTIKLWEELVSKLISAQVSPKDEVTKGLWKKLSKAITFAELQMWKEAIDCCSEAYLMVEETYGKNATKHQVFAWTMHIYHVSTEKSGFGDDQLRFDAAHAMKLAEDKIETFDFQDTMFRLFPYKFPIAPEAPQIESDASDL